MVDCYVLGFVTALRFLQSQILYRLLESYKSPLDETVIVNRGPPCVHTCTHAKRSHTHVKDLVVHISIQRTMEMKNNPVCAKSAVQHNLSSFCSVTVEGGSQIQRRRNFMSTVAELRCPSPCGTDVSATDILTTGDQRSSNTQSETGNEHHPEAVLYILLLQYYY